MWAVPRAVLRAASWVDQSVETEKTKVAVTADQLADQKAGLMAGLWADRKAAPMDCSRVDLKAASTERLTVDSRVDCSVDY